MNSKPLFSVIIPTYNRGEKLKRAIESVIKQTYNNYEIIVCDDGSNDNTKEIITDYSSFDNLKYIWNENWGGPARPRNIGIKNAKGTWICFLDSDDWWYPNKLEVVTQYLSKADVMYHDVDVYRSRGKIKKRRIKSRQLKKPIMRDLMTKNNRLHNSSFVVNKKIIEKVGGLAEDRSLIAVEDFDLWLRISNITEKFVYIPRSIGALWLDNDNITKMSEKQITRYKAVYDKHLKYLTYKDRKDAVNFMNYIIGRIKQKMNNPHDAKKYFIHSMRTRNLNVRLKSTFCLAICTFNLLKNGKRLN